MDDKSSFHKENLRLALAMEQGRKQILDILCGSTAALQVLAQDYAAIKPSEKSLAELLHVHAHRFADDDDIAQNVVRNRAARVAKRCEELSTRKTISAIDRRQLVDEMYDIRLPDSQMVTIPDRALEAKFCDASHARRLELLTAGSERHVRDARMQMVETNLPLLGCFLYGYHVRPDFEDIQSEGKLGLMAATDRWDPKSRMRFSSYAVPYIQGYAVRYIQNHGSLIRVPVHMHAELDKLQHVETRYLAQHGDIPSAEIVANTSNIKLETVEKLRAIRRDDRPYEHPELYDVTWSPSNRALEPASPQILEQKIEQKECQQHILCALQTLTPREERVLKLRLGLDGDDEMTLEEAGHVFGVSQERIRQIEDKALRKLRHPSRAQHLRSFVFEGEWFTHKKMSGREMAQAEERRAEWIAWAKARQKQLALERVEREKQFQIEQEERNEARRQAKEEKDAAIKAAELAELREDLKDPHVRMMLEDPRVAPEGLRISDLDEIVAVQDGRKRPRPALRGLPRPQKGTRNLEL